ncbi:restriction endonuclease subunit S [Thalassospira tepidiphila]|uniref:restriction endonuclease subunit S n=1 Tax=Thalassospira tepidiphila TaxID=393657 RepID=UPI001BCAEC5A|nr:restriction endonuclease subunit S [Thalassospira tepidiphila]MBS8275597.1 restriction endonuclease subunit S [Thalassospira tepidiphila]
MNWPNVSIEDTAEVKGGKRLPKGHDFAGTPTRHLYIRARDIGAGKIQCDQPVYISDETHSKISRYTVEAGDIVITIVGANVGDVGYVTEELAGANLTENAAKLVVDRQKHDPVFLKYFLSSKLSKDRLAFLASGAAQGKLGLYKIKRFSIPRPPLPIQKNVASILSTYDDLIENNRRRIALLEEAARLLYREWFVHFRFPGHEHVKIIDGVPEGWKLTSPDRFIANHIGGGWGKDEPEGQHTAEVYVIRGTDIPNLTYGGKGGAGVRYEKESSLRSRLLTTCDVIFEVSGGSSIQPIARTLLVTDSFLKRFDHPVICASFCKRLSFGNEKEALFFHYHVLENRDNGRVLQFQKESASSLKNFNFKGFLETYQLLVPSEHLMGAFFDEVCNLIQQKEILAQSIFQLEHARDLLLPRLMDGRLEV